MGYRGRVWQTTLQDWRGYTRANLSLGGSSAIVVGGISFILQRYVNAATLSLPDIIIPVVSSLVALFAWAFCALIFFFLRAPKKLDEATQLELAETTSRITELEDRRPTLHGTLKHYKNRLILELTNEGAPADVWARVTVGGATLSRCSNADAVWDHDLTSTRTLIASGERRSICIAESRHAERATGADIFRHYWWVSYFESNKVVTTRSLEPSFPSPNDQNIAARQELVLEVFSSPPSLSPVRFSLTLVGSLLVEDVQGIAYIPREPYSE